VPKRTNASIVADPGIADRAAEEETQRMPAVRRHSIAVFGVIAALAVAIPVMGADPSPSTGASESVTPAASPSAAESDAPEVTSPEPAEASPDHAATSAEPEETAQAPSSESAPKVGNPPKGPKAPKAAKAPEVAVTVTGTVTRTTDGKGRPGFTITNGSTTWELSAGPPWYWGDKNPLAAYVGKSVTAAGTTEQGSSELDVETVDGTAIRAAGKPPWAGGPWVVGSTHPGWKPWMADGKPGKGHGAQEKSNAPGKPEASPGS
jgi:hypothetical protein